MAVQCLSVVWHDSQIKGNHKGCPHGINASFRMGISLNSDNRVTLRGSMVSILEQCEKRAAALSEGYCIHGKAGRGMVRLAVAYRTAIPNKSE